jgi:tetratricopeptide (TPR) repeat protein
VNKTRKLIFQLCLLVLVGVVLVSGASAQDMRQDVDVLKINCEDFTEEQLWAAGIYYLQSESLSYEAVLDVLDCQAKLGMDVEDYIHSVELLAEDNVPANLNIEDCLAMSAIVKDMRLWPYCKPFSSEDAEVTYLVANALIEAGLLSDAEETLSEAYTELNLEREFGYWLHLHQVYYLQGQYESSLSAAYQMINIAHDFPGGNDYRIPSLVARGRSYLALANEQPNMDYLDSAVADFVEMRRLVGCNDDYFVKLQIDSFAEHGFSSQGLNLHLFSGCRYNDYLMVAYARALDESYSAARVEVEMFFYLNPGIPLKEMWDQDIMLLREIYVLLEHNDLEIVEAEIARRFPTEHDIFGIFD